MTGTAWEHQREAREALQTIVSGPAVSRRWGVGADRHAPIRTLRRLPAAGAPAPLDDSIL